MTVCCAVLQVFKKEMEKMPLHKTEDLKDLDKVSVSLYEGKHTLVIVSGFACSLRTSSQE